MLSKVRSPCTTHMCHCVTNACTQCLWRQLVRPAFVPQYSSASSSDPPTSSHFYRTVKAVKNKVIRSMFVFLKRQPEAWTRLLPKAQRVFSVPVCVSEPTSHVMVSVLVPRVYCFGLASMIHDQRMGGARFKGGMQGGGVNWRLREQGSKGASKREGA